MKTLSPKSHWLSLLVALGFCLTLVGFPASADEKMRAEDVVAKHLASIGAEETRASIRNRIAGGTVVATVTAPGIAKFDGQCIMASEGSKNMIAMGFESPGTFQEKVMFDGSKVTVGQSATRK